MRKDFSIGTSDVDEKISDDEWLLMMQERAIDDPRSQMALMQYSLSVTLEKMFELHPDLLPLFVQLHRDAFSYVEKTPELERLHKLKWEM